MKKHAIALLALASLSAHGLAAVSADEAKELGKSLTKYGAIKAGNKEGTIPEYTGGLTKAPADFKPKRGFWADPFKDEKAVLRIDGKNVDQYADKLSEGQKTLLKKYPTYYMDVYPSHRTAAIPAKVLDATVRNATTCKTLKNGLAVEADCRGGLPFPIPKTGYEVMWNLQLRYKADTTTKSSRSWVVDSSGKAVMTAQQQTLEETPYYHADLDGRDPLMYWRTHSITQSPVRKAGEATGIVDYLDPTEKPRRAWSYTPGQRRVKLAPEFSYDTPVSSMGGVTLFDELFVFSGMMDRFDFKLVGKKEMIIPYNDYKMAYNSTKDELLKPKFLNPDVVRWEQHRVWVVEANLREGKRHVYSKRTFYIDEDSWTIVASDQYDARGQLFRAGFAYVTPSYDAPAPWADMHGLYDLIAGSYSLSGYTAETGGMRYGKPASEREWSPDALAGAGIR